MGGGFAVKTKFKHWGFYLMVAAFVIYLVVQFIVRPLLRDKGGC